MESHVTGCEHKLLFYLLTNFLDGVGIPERPINDFNTASWACVWLFRALVPILGCKVHTQYTALYCLLYNPFQVPAEKTFEREQTL